MLTMFQRQLGAPSNTAIRQGSSELQASPCALSRGSSRSNSFSRRVPSGCTGSIPQSRSRSSLLVACSGPIGPLGDDNTSDSNSHNEAQHQGYGEHRGQQQQPRDGSSNMPRADVGASHPSSPSPLSHSSRPRSDHNTWDFDSEPFVPSPSNLPTDEDELLYPPRTLRPLQKDLWTLTAQPGVDLFRAGPQTWKRLGQVYVILFGVGERDTEGIYSLRAFGSDGIPHETIIAFECEEEAQRYAGLLEASMDHTPHVCSISPRELLTFCVEQSYSCRLEPKGSLLIPPDFNVSVTDWERSLRLREGKFSVLESEPDTFSATASGGGGLGGGGSATATATTTTTSAAAAAAPTGPPGGGGGSGSGSLTGSSLNVKVPGGQASNLARYASGLGGEALEDIRARLEALLPANS